MYLPLETTFAIFVGGMIKGIIDRIAARRNLNPAQKTRVDNVGILLASGLIAGEALTGLVRAAWKFMFFQKVIGSDIPEIFKNASYYRRAGRHGADRPLSHLSAASPRGQGRRAAAAVGRDVRRKPLSFAMPLAKWGLVSASVLGFRTPWRGLDGDRDPYPRRLRNQSRRFPLSISDRPPSSEAASKRLQLPMFATSAGRVITLTDVNTPEEQVRKLK